MLSVALKILSILGILLLCLLGLVIVLILLVLFFPVSYRLTGKKDAKELSVCVRVSWLLGLLRVLFDYPELGTIRVKVLPFTVFDSGKQSGGEAKEKTGSPKGKQEQGKETEEERKEEQKEKASRGKQEPVSSQGQEPDADADRKAKANTDGLPPAAQEEASPAETPEASEEAAKASEEAASEARKASQEEDDSSDPLILKKFKKIKYTIRSIYDKIKNIWENISYYMELLREEETRQLFSHVIFRLGKILKSIRPRRIRGQLLFGTGSPDTTGYAYGVYGMLSPFLGSKLLVTPDFTKAVLEGNLAVAGHITVFTILWNGLKVLLDKKLRRFVKKMNAGRKK